jgi:hypothetical protein
LTHGCVDAAEALKLFGLQDHPRHFEVLGANASQDLLESVYVRNTLPGHVICLDRAWETFIPVLSQSSSGIELDGVVRVPDARQDKPLGSRLRIETLFSLHPHMPGQHFRLAGSALPLAAK